MTVKQAIEALKQMPDHTMKILVDCPHCGRAQQLASFDQIIIVRGRTKEIVHDSTK